MSSRRNFLKLAGTAALAAGTVPVFSSPRNQVSTEKKPHTFTLGMAGYTFREFTVEQTISMMKRVGVTNLSVKDFHMPMNSTREQIDEVIGKFKAGGINVYTVGVIYMKTPESVDQAFAYAKMAGVNMIVGAPDYELLPYVEQKVKSSGIRLAIHNHRPDNPLYPNATDIWDHIKDLDSQIGICLDIGHTLRDGQNINADLIKYKSRIYDIHIKDVNKASKEGTTVEIGRGIIDIPGFIETLGKISYQGSCSLEFEKDMKDSLPGIAESIGYFKGVMACR
jgi:sugar phosphate isomerase/epimerase